MAEEAGEGKEGGGKKVTFTHEGHDNDEGVSGRKVCFTTEAPSVVPYSYTPEPMLTDFFDDEVGERLYQQGMDQMRRWNKVTPKRVLALEEGGEKTLEDLNRRGVDDAERFRKNVLPRLEQFQATVQKKIEKKRAEDKKAVEEIRSHTLKISKTTERIITQKKAKGCYASPDKDWRKQFAQYVSSREKRAEGDPAVETFKPTINPCSKTLQRQGDPFERLHAMAAEKEEGLVMLRAWDQDKELIDPETGAPRFQPQVLHSPRATLYYENSRMKGKGAQSPSASSCASGSTYAKRRSFDELVQHLSEKGMAYRQKRDQRSQAKDAMCSFSPQTNPTSSLILERAGPRPPLYQPTSTLASWRSMPFSPSSQGAGASPPSYEYSLAERAEQQRRRRDAKASHEAFLARQYRELHNKQLHIHELHQKLVQEELADCSFHPKVGRRSNSIFAKSSYAALGQGGQQPAERRRSRSRPASLPEESPTCQFLRELEHEHARDRAAGAAARRARSASPGARPTEPPPPPPPPVPPAYAPVDSPLWDDEVTPPMAHQPDPPAVPPVADSTPRPVPPPSMGGQPPRKLGLDKPQEVPPLDAGGKPAPQTSPFLASLHSELCNVINEWKGFVE